MKRIALTALLLLFGLPTLLAQLHLEPGIKAGLNFSSLATESVDDGNNRTSFHIGLLGHIHINRSWAVQPELVYSSQGAKYGNNTVLKLGYINVPVLAQYMFGPGFRVETGPQFGFNINAKSDVGGNETDIKDRFKGFGMSWAFGVGYLSEMGLGADLRYNLGLSDISKAGNNVKNSVWQVGLFYQFRKMDIRK